MIHLKYSNNRLSLRRLTERKIGHWNAIGYISTSEAEILGEKYSDKRRSFGIPIRTLLFLATTVFILGGIFLVGLLSTKLNPIALFMMGATSLVVYEVHIGKKYSQAGIDKALILVGGLLLIASVLWMFNDNKIENPIQFLIVAVVAWLIATRYYNYFAFYSAFILLQLCVFNYVQMDFPFGVFIIFSIVVTLCFVLYFSKRRKKLSPYLLRWNETLEVFFLLMVMAFLNPMVQESLHAIFKNGSSADPAPYFNDHSQLLMIFLNGIFATVLMVLGILRQVRAYIIVSICALFVGLLTIWHYFFQELNQNVIYTISGIGLIFLGLFLNAYLKKPKWRLTSRKIPHQNNLTHVFESVEKISKKMGIN